MEILSIKLTNRVPPIANMPYPITVNPLTKVTWLRDEQYTNASSPKYKNIGLINDELWRYM